MKLCLICYASGAHEHHTLPKSVWPEHRDNPACLIPLCAVCHDAWHRCFGNVPWDMLPRATQALITAAASSQWIERWYPQRAHADLPF